MEQPLTNAVIDFIEAYHTGFGDFPGRSQIINAISIATDGILPSPQELDELLESENFLKSLDERGIIPPWLMMSSPVGLTAEQLAVVAALNNTEDRRSNSRKLLHLGVSERKFGGWMHNRKFTEYMRLSANNLLENTEAAAHTALLSRVKAGDPSALKFYFEMTGRYNPNHETAVNLQQLMTKFVEIVQKHVKDKDLLMAIGADLQLAMVETGAHEVTNSSRASRPKLTSTNEFEKQRKALYF